MQSWLPDLIMQRGNGNVIVIIRVTSIEDSQANVILDEDNSYIEWHDRDDWGEHHIVLRGKYCRWLMRECKMKWEYILSWMAWLTQLNNHLNFKEKLVEKHPHSLFKAKTPTLLHFLKDVQSVHIDQHPLEHPLSLCAKWPHQHPQPQAIMSLFKVFALTNHIIYLHKLEC